MASWFSGRLAASFRPDLLMGELFEASRAQPVDLELFDAPEAAPGRLIYDRDPGSAETPRELSRTVPVIFGGQTWTLQLSTLPAFHSLAERLVPFWVLGSGLVISVLALASCVVWPPASRRTPGGTRRLGA